MWIDSSAAKSLTEQKRRHDRSTNSPGLLRSNKKGTPRAQLHGKKENESETSSAACETMGAEEEEDNNREETIDRACGRSYDGVRKSAAAQVRSQR
jgi:hypothetical protein